MSSPSPTPTPRGPPTLGCTWFRGFCGQKGPRASLPLHEQLKYTHMVSWRVHKSPCVTKVGTHFMCRDPVLAFPWRVTLVQLVKGLGLGIPQEVQPWGNMRVVHSTEQDTSKG